jgi:alpha-1,2-glucosyltransferase
MFILALAGLVLHRFTLSHPFLLADNRHYVFYLWRRVFQRYPFANLFLTPLYALAGWWLTTRVYQGSGASRRSSSLTVLVVGVAVALVLVPAHLLEPRYFTLPLVMTLLEAPPRSHTSLLLSTVLFVFIDALTVYVFLYRPFLWGDGSVARFMW